MKKCGGCKESSFGCRQWLTLRCTTADRVKNNLGGFYGNKECRKSAYLSDRVYRNSSPIKRESWNVIAHKLGKLKYSSLKLWCDAKSFGQFHWSPDCLCSTFAALRFYRDIFASFKPFTLNHFETLCSS